MWRLCGDFVAVWGVLGHYGGVLGRYVAVMERYGVFWGDFWGYIVDFKTNLVSGLFFEKIYMCKLHKLIKCENIGIFIEKKMLTNCLMYSKINSPRKMG